MIRSGFKPKLLAAEPKRRTRKCKICREPFEPRSMTHKVCGAACAETLASQDKARKLRMERQAGLQKLKRRADYLKEAQREFNTFIRLRDREQPCICCGRTSTKVDGLGAHGWDCGHYRSVGSAPHLRFDERNAHRQLVYCNRHGAGKAVDYRIGLIARIGQGQVDSLESDDTPRKFDVAELIEIKNYYKAKAKELKEKV